MWFKGVVKTKHNRIRVDRSGSERVRTLFSTVGYFRLTNNIFPFKQTVPSLIEIPKITKRCSIPLQILTYCLFL